MRSLATLAACLSACLLVVPAYAGSPARHTARQAETNLLRAARVLGRASPALIDRTTGLVKNNSTAHCRGVGLAQRGAFVSFDCVVRNGLVQVSVRYLSEPHNGFELRRIKVSRGH